MAATRPTDARIRAYNVGFGDCFLLSLLYARSRARHVLIDFGSTALPKRNGPPSMLAVARQIEADCGGKLEMVVATHRHADHISGFGGSSGDVIASLDPELVVQPWTEEPDLARDAQAPSARRVRGSRRAVARLGEMHLVAEAITRQIRRLENARVPKTLTAQLGFVGETNLKNLPAVRKLQRLGRKRVYAQFGTKLATQRILPGVKIDVLGPPSLEQSGAIAHQADTDPDEFWHLAATSARVALTDGAVPIFPDAPQASVPPQEARWVIPQIDRMHAEELLALVRILDDAMNNTSLILLFEIAGTRLLFPGDAQLENWRYALHDAPNAKQIRTRLAATRVYKVGHHGSLNATPKQLLWDAFAHKTANAKDKKRLISVVSTMAGKHGATSRGTEVPRRTLMTELEDNSTLYTTQTGTTRTKFWRDVPVQL